MPPTTIHVATGSMCKFAMAPLVLSISAMLEVNYYCCLVAAVTAVFHLARMSHRGSKQANQERGFESQQMLKRVQFLPAEVFGQQQIQERRGASHTLFRVSSK